MAVPIEPPEARGLYRPECDHHFPEIIVEEGDFGTDSVLKTGDKIIGPCSECGEPPWGEFDWLTRTLDEVCGTLNQVMVRQDQALFHWSPAKHRFQIEKYGLVPHRRAVTNSVGSVLWRAPYICFSLDPVWAWMLSGWQRGSPPGEWDLWQTWASLVPDLQVLPGDDYTGVHEVRTASRVYKRHLKYIGSRVK